MQEAAGRLLTKREPQVRETFVKTAINDFCQAFLKHPTAGSIRDFSIPRPHHSIPRPRSAAAGPASAPSCGDEPGVTHTPGYEAPTRAWAMRVSSRNGVVAGDGPVSLRSPDVDTGEGALDGCGGGEGGGEESRLPVRCIATRKPPPPQHTHRPPLTLMPPTRSSREWNLEQPCGPHHRLQGAWTASSVLFASRPLLPSLLQATTPEHLRRLQQGWFVTAHTHTHLVFV